MTTQTDKQGSSFYGIPIEWIIYLCISDSDDEAMYGGATDSGDDTEDELRK